MRTRLLLAALAALLLLSSCGPREIEPEVLRYFTAETVQRHDEFKVPHRWNIVIDPVLYLAFVGILFGFKLNRRLKLWAERVTRRWGETLGKVRGLSRLGAIPTLMWRDDTWGGALLFTLCFMLLMYALNAPGAFYLTWWYEHQHGTSVETLGHWFWDIFKAAITEAPKLFALVFGVYGLARWLRLWWLPLGLICAVGILVLGGILDPLMTQVFVDQERLQEGPVKQAVAATLKKAGVEYEDVFVEKRVKFTRRTNAYIAGDGPTRRIVLWDTLIMAMTPEEIANAVAHEVGHLKDRSPGQLVFASIAIIPALWALALLLRRLGKGGRWGFDDDRDVASLPMMFFLCWVASLFVDPVGNAYSRYLETRADRYALELLEQPAAFRSLMVKLARNNLADVHPPAYIRYVFAGHPPVMERIAAAEAFASSRGLPMPEARPDLFVLSEELDPLKQQDKEEAARAAQRAP
ncbi:MAG TPA: M48 family metalloprotease [Myxococcales bacterium]|jgi:STE24 endopeptidase